MRLFVYGSLLDAEVRADLMGAARGQMHVFPAVLLHHRRRCSAGGDFPVLVPSTGARVPGLLVERLDRRTAFWIAHFEGAGYRLARVKVVRPNGESLRPWCFLSAGPVADAGIPWNLRAWQRTAKPATRRAIVQWSRTIGPNHPLSLDVPWLVRRQLRQICTDKTVDQAKPVAESKSHRAFDIARTSQARRIPPR